MKRLNKEASSMTASTADQTFNYEVAELSRLRHPNLIRILGYSNDNRESVCLIYPYFVNGNLEDRILMKRTKHQEASKKQLEQVIAQQYFKGSTCVQTATCTYLT